jgi:hypothetical protein
VPPEDLADKRVKAMRLDLKPGRHGGGGDAPSPLDVTGRLQDRDVRPPPCIWYMKLVSSDIA